MNFAGVLLGVDAASAIEVRGATTSAVLVALYERDGELRTVLTERRADLSRHAGEISFPGGRRDPQDPDLLATALREAEEEIGLPRAAVNVVGALTPTPTIASGYAIYPYVGMIEPGHLWVPSPGEVQAILEFSVGELATGYARRQVRRRGVPIWTDTYVVDGHLVWGATARILADLLQRLTRTKPAA